MIINVKKRKYAIVVVLVIALFFNAFGSQKEAKEERVQSEVLWDTWGVPHIFAKDAKGLFYAFGWAQMEAHGDAILHYYGSARGRASEYWGERFFEQDRLMLTMDIPDRANRWYAAQSPNFRAYLDEFVRGMNDYSTKHIDKISKELRVVLPVRGPDILAHLQYVIHISFVGQGFARSSKEWQSAGSNGWAIAPSHASGDRSMLLINPHLPWSGFYLWFEAQLTAPGIDAYGATLIGIPVLLVGFNDYLGWTHTVNTLDGMDLYELKPVDGGYRMDGKTLAFDSQIKTLKVKQKDGTYIEKEMSIRRSVHGPVINEKPGKVLAVRLVGLDQPYTWEQYWDMMQATNLEQFETALKRLQMPFLNTIYADRDGHIMYQFGGRLPKRPFGNWNDWLGVVPGDTSRTLWTETHSYDELPKVVDPSCGWVQNANDPPWSSTSPMTLKPGNFPSYLSPEGMDYRTQRSIRMLTSKPKISFDDVIQFKHSTRMEMADQILDDLISNALRFGGPLAKKAADVLGKWDRCADAQSRGAALFYSWAEKMGTGVSADPKLAVAALEEAAQKMINDYGALDIPWGDIFRIGIPGKDFPGNGGPGALGIFRVIEYDPVKDKRFLSVFGDSFTAVVEFSNPVKAKALLSYGNASQLHSAHSGDQLELLSKKELRPVWRTREEIEKHLERKEVF